MICNNPNISEISTTINYNPPSFLENPIKSSLKLVKTDLELYNNKYIELSEEVNNLTQTSIEILTNLSYPIENMKNELKNAYEQFKDLIKNISIPLIAYKKLLSDIRILNENIDDKSSLFYQIEEYRNESEKLNNIYNKIFNYFEESVQIINNEIKGFPNLIIELQK